MTSFDKTTTDAQVPEGTKAETPPETETKEEVKAEEQKHELVCRIKASPAMWEDACNLVDMLSFCRPHQSSTEHRFINKHIRPHGIKFDRKGNIYKKIGDAPVLWSCHTDTVHTKKGMQKIEYWVDGKTSETFFGVPKSENSSCLGADDTSGIWIMLEMIKAKVPGTYIFHRGEEQGGIGSRWIAKNNKEILKGIRFAIAFDRRDTESIITFQGSKRCCSDEFAKSLAEQLGLNHRCDETGMWTDTASYVDDIAECTNISTGYYNAHSADERLNVDYLFRLRDAICKVDISKLVEKRKPGENTSRFGSYTYTGSEDSYWGGWWTGKNGVWRKKSDSKPEGHFTGMELNDRYGFNNWAKWFEWDTTTSYWKLRKGVTIPKNADKTKQKDLGVTKGWSWKKAEPAFDASQYEMIRMVRDNPAIVADLLESQGYGPLDLKDYILLAGGFLYGDPPGY